ncbi:unnamed protein product [Cylicocyclus nassatus]|uniref:Muscleblind-like protein n=1 Tax=Cylicocyclus nassatus TaxID=53992 RepID=A0AA36HE65_CYLNA|nr:unnamed protein product [Cylicocyclus nassatus]
MQAHRDSFNRARDLERCDGAAVEVVSDGDDNDDDSARGLTATPSVQPSAFSPLWFSLTPAIMHVHSRFTYYVRSVPIRRDRRDGAAANAGFMFDENSNTAAGAAPNSAIVTQLLNVKDSRWLQVEVCREFQRGQCARSDLECKFAHPPPHVDVQQGRVTACYDSIKGRCTRENPKCKYLHPPQHIKDQLLINGRNNLALKNLISAQLNQTATGQPIAVNPIAQIMQQQQAVAAANMMPTLPFPYYQGLVYSPVLQADPYQAAVSQQLQAAALLHGGGGGLLAAPAQLAQAAAAGVALAAAPSAAALQLPLAVSAATAASRKRPLDEESLAADQQQAHFLNLAAAVSAAAGVPCKRPAVDKNGAVVYSANPQPAQQFNPYVLPGLQGYVPAVSSNERAPYQHAHELRHEVLWFFELIAFTVLAHRIEASAAVRLSCNCT